MQIEMTAWIGPETESENEFRPPDERIDEFHPKATRTLFIGNLEKTTTCDELCNIFQRFGGIVDIDMKRVNGIPQYAFLQFSDIASVCKAIKKMDGEYLGNNRLKLGFGKSMPTNCVWLDGLATSLTDQYLTRHFCRYGPVVKVGEPFFCCMSLRLFLSLFLFFSLSLSLSHSFTRLRSEACGESQLGINMAICPETEVEFEATPSTPPPDSPD
ncbi:PREDICTED: msx2-interacting protein-like [Thamnophis sirtalis]|uniref:Msx2-interacting protein-like n=1 Tax=Thamnophis sirtalis TaxID=35019 RepID=A0A6I9Y798_9SAUR|nr:PREDICTED: msx2-interacting protein-like [Thamnophis sirtalis]